MIKAKNLSSNSKSLMNRSNQGHTLRKSLIKIQTCKQCHLHQEFQQHDEYAYFDLIQKIQEALKKKHLYQHFKIQKNKPFKYLSKLFPNHYGKKKLSTNCFKQKFIYVNQISKKQVSFPRIGAFEVYYQNCVIYSKLNSVYRIFNKKETQDKQQCSISSQILAELIVGVIQILQENLQNFHFLNKIQGIFRFLDMEWKPINYSSSLIDYLLQITPKKQRSDINSILLKFKEIINGNSKIQFKSKTQFNNLTSLKGIKPYNIYCKKQKQSRIRSIYKQQAYKQKSRSKVKSFKSNSSYSQKSIQSHVSKEKSQNSFINLQNQKKTQNANIDNNKKTQKISKANGLTFRTKKIQGSQQYPTKSTPHTQRNFKHQIKKPTLFNVSSQMMIKKNMQSPVPYLQNIKEKLLTNRIYFERIGIKQNSKQRLTESRFQCGNVKGIRQKHNQNGQKVYRFLSSERRIQRLGTKQLKSSISTNINIEYHSPTSRNRPLSSTQRINRIESNNQKPKQSKILSGSEQIKQTNQIISLEKDNLNVDKNLPSYTRQPSKNISRQKHKDLQNNNKTKSTYVKNRNNHEKCLSAILDERGRNKEHKQRKQTQTLSPKKDFIRQNILRASSVKRINNYGLSFSYWQEINKETLLQMKEKRKKSRKIRQKSCANLENLTLQKGTQLQNQYKSKKLEKLQLYQDMTEINDKEKEKCINLKKTAVKSCKQFNMKPQNSLSIKNKSNRHSISEGIQFKRQINEPNLVSQWLSQRKQHDDRIGQQIGKTKEQQKEYPIISNQIQFKNYKLQEQEQKQSLIQQVAYLEHQDQTTKGNLIAYPLALNQQQQENHLSSIQYYNNNIFLSIQSTIKYEPAYITQQFDYYNIENDKHYLPNLLRKRDIQTLDQESHFTFQQEEIYQEFTTKSLSQLYKFDEITLFPSGNKWSFNPQELMSLYREERSRLSEVVDVLLKINNKIISRLFENPKSISYLGYYGVWLYSSQTNKFQLFIVNDQFPVSSKNFCSNSQSFSKHDFIFSCPLIQNSIWYMIFQKAIAKYLGGYNKIEMCTFGQLLKIITGCQTVQFRNLNPEKMCQFLNQKMLNRKKAHLFAQDTSNKYQKITDSQYKQYCSRIERITGYNFNSRNPYLSLIHFQSYTNRINSLTFMDFVKQFQSIILAFFNPNYFFNQRKIEFKQEKTRVKNIFEISSSSYKKSICYIEIGLSQIHRDHNNYYRSHKKDKNISKVQMETRLKFFFQLTNQKYQQCDIQQKNETYRYNGEIKKPGHFFFEMQLKPGKNILFLQSYLNFNSIAKKCGNSRQITISFYSQESLKIKQLSEQQHRKLKLLNGKDVSNMSQKVIKLKNRNKECQQKGTGHPINKISLQYKQNDHNTHRKINSSRMKENIPLKHNTKLKQQAKKQFLKAIQNRTFLEDQFNGNELVDQKCKIKIKKRRRVIF